MPGKSVGSGNYVVQPGDCMASIAVDHGFLWQTLWDLPENSELRQVRKDPNVLLPGDQVHIPDLRTKWESRATEAKHTFVKKGVPSLLKVVVLDDDDKPLANEPYVLEIDGKSSTGYTDGKGIVEQRIPPNAQKGVLRVGQDENRREYFLNLGHMDPVEEVTGLQARLRNLGFYDGEVDGEFNADTKSAVLIFQEKYKLEATGKNDEATRAKLKQAYGC